MKKKIINGIMMVALVAATSTSFVSCKDTNEDVRIEQSAEIAQLKGQLQTLENKYGDMDGRISALSQRVDDEVERLDGRIDDVELDLDGLQEEVDQLENWLNETFAKLVTSVSISGTYTNMTGSINVPGFEPKMLINNYGVAEKQGTFPENKDLIMIDAQKDGFEWAANQVIGASPFDETTPGAAGYIYATINRYIDSVPLLSKLNDGFFTFSLVNTAGEAIPGVLIENMDEDGNPTTDVLKWGWTRADNNIYKLGVVFSGDPTAKGLQPAKIDLSKIKDDLKALYQNRKSSTDAKKSLGHLAADLYYNIATRDTNLPKYALKIGWSDFTVNEVDEEGNITDSEALLHHMSSSEAELLFATIKPLSFESGDVLKKGAEAVTNSVNNIIDKSEKHIDEILYRIQGKLAEQGININNYYLPELIFNGIRQDAAGNYILRITGAQLNQALSTTNSKDIDININKVVTPEELAYIKNNDNVDAIKALLGKVNGKNIGDWMEKFTNKASSIFQNNAGQLLQPVLLAIDKDGNVNRVSGIKNAPYEVNGEVTLEPTTYTAELFAPAYAKFVAVKSIEGGDEMDVASVNAGAAPENAEGFGEIIAVNDKDIKFTPKAGTTYEIVYEAVDFFGKTYNHSYYIKGKAVK